MIHMQNHTQSSLSMEKRKKKMISKEEKEGSKKIKQKKQNGGYGFIINSEEERIKLVESEKEKETHNISDSSHRHEEKPKTDYIHVRARRGQATDSHSLAERARREKIRERFQFLQSLVPGCDKIAGKAQVLDEIIKYVQSLQNLVECLAAKLASVNSTMNGFEFDPLMSTQAPDQTSSLNAECYFEFPQFSSFADTSPTTTPAFASTEIFQDDGDLFLGLNDQSQNMDLGFLDSMSNF